MKPGVIVNISRNHNDRTNSNPQSNDWYREEKWKRINDWISEIEKETIKKDQELALIQTRNIKTILASIKNREKYKEQSLQSYDIASKNSLFNS